MSRRSNGWISLAAGVGLLVALGAMGYQDSQDVAPRYSMALLVVFGLGAILLLAAGVSLLVADRQATTGAPDEQVSYRHTLRPFGVLAGLFLLAFAARGLAVPGDFGRDGPYRAGARDESRHGLAVREVQPALAGEQELAPHRGHGVVEIDGHAGRGQRLGGHQPGRPAANHHGRQHALRRLHCGARSALRSSAPISGLAANGSLGLRASMMSSMRVCTMPSDFGWL